MEPTIPVSGKRKTTGALKRILISIAIGIVIIAVFAVALVSVKLRAENPQTDWANWSAANPDPENLDFKLGTQGWFQPPASHALATVDSKGGPHGEPCVVLTPSGTNGDTWSSLQQLIGGSSFLGKRIRLSALLKADQVSGEGDLSMRVASPEGSPYAQGPVVSGTSGWEECSVVLDVPADSPGLGIGVSLYGRGALRVADVKLETVGKDVPLSASATAMQSGGRAEGLKGRSGVNWAAANPQVENLNFKNGIDGWFQPPASQASASVDPKGGPHGEPCLVLTPTNVAGSQWASLQQAFLARSFRGHRVRLTALLKAEGIKRGAAIAMGADSPEAYYFAGAPTLTGTTGWQPRSVVVDVPADGVGVCVDLSVGGAGTLRVADVRLDTVGKNVPVTPEYSGQ